MPDEEKGAFSLSFAATSSKHRRKRVKVNEDEDKPQQEYVTGLSENGLTFRDSDNPQNCANGQDQKIIPNLGNNLRGTGPKAFNPNRFLPQKEDLQKPEAGADRFEVAAPEAQPEVKYGLTTFRTDQQEKESASPGRAGDADAASHSAEPNGRGPSRKGRRVIGTGHDWETEAYQNDVDQLPEQASLEEYEAMPVEAFGEAMLRGMGWNADRDNVEAQAKQYVRRAPLLGLGATAAPPAHKEKRFIKPGESREAKRELVVYDSQGNIKHTRTAEEKLVERIAEGPAVGKTMRILKGRHAGLLCHIKTILPEVSGHSQKADVRLLPSEELVSVRLKDLGERDEQPPKEEKELKERTEAGKGAAMMQNGREEQAITGRDSPGGVEMLWLAPHIRVKVVDKRIGKGRLYLKKGEIMDVLTPSLCSVLLDTGERLDAHHGQLETVIPKKEGARLLVVSGRLRGRRARLLKRSTESSQAAVQLSEDFSVHKVSFDEISEYVGDFGDDE